MSISNQTDRVGPLTINSIPQGINTIFPFQLPSDLLVLNLGTFAVPIDAATILVLNSDYTVAGGGYDSNNNMQAGSITLNGAGINPVVVGDNIVIMRAVPLTQLSSATTGPLTGVLVEQALDKSATIDQQLQEQASRSLRFENFETIGGTLPLASRRNSYQAYDLNGNPIFFPTSPSGYFSFVVTPQQFGAKGDGLTDDTAAVQAAINSLVPNGGTVYFPAGSYLITQLNMPNDPLVVNLIGVAVSSVFLIMGTAAGPMIRKAQTAGRIIGATFANFTIVANPFSSRANTSHIALNLEGYSGSTFRKLSYLSNPNGTGAVRAVFYLIANNYQTYQNKFSEIEVHETLAPSRVFWFDSAGLGFLKNSNICEIENCLFYALPGANAVVDCIESTLVTIRNCWFESIYSSNAILLGQLTTVEGCWFEDMTTPLTFTDNTGTTPLKTSSTSCIIQNNYFSGGFVQNIPLNCHPNWFIANFNETFTGAGSPFLLDDPGTVPAAPTVTASAGTLTGLASSVQSKQDTLGQITYLITGTSTASGAPLSFNFAIGAVTNYNLVSLTFGLVRNANGKPCPWGILNTLAQVWVDQKDTDSHQLTILATYKKIAP